MASSEKLYNDPEIGEVLFRKSRKATRVSIRVQQTKGVVVVIPHLMPYEAGMKFFNVKREWIIRTLAKQKQNIDSAHAGGGLVERLGNGSVVKTLLSHLVFRRLDIPSEGNPGASVTPEILEDPQTSTRRFYSLDQPFFREIVSYTADCPAEGSRELDTFLRRAVVQVLRNEAKYLLPRKLEIFAGRYGFNYNRVVIKHNSSNWGSCSTKGNINLNLNLVRVPEPLCDYVILHELTHLCHPNHGPQFHTRLEQLCAGNVAHLSALGDPCVPALLEKIHRSTSPFPYSTTLSAVLRKYKLV